MSDNPLLRALPPATDYLTYLTVLEYNLTGDQLPTLHEVLQDPELTSNIGWDLVHLLLPLLPAAELCLHDVARLGNPREVVLKVTESLRALEITDNVEEPDHEDVRASHVVEGDGESGSGSVGAERNGERREYSAGEIPTRTDGGKIPESPTALAVRQFITLVSMLATLHPRIKTKYPSRFLSTSLRAVLKAYAQLAWLQDATTSVLQLITTLSGQKRPNLPPRMSSSEVQTTTSQPSAPDPEAQSDVPTAEEMALQQRLLQSFVTHGLEDYMSCMSSAEGVTGMAWTSRLQEKAHPEKVIPGRKTNAERFAQSGELHARDGTIGQILALARDLALDSRELLLTVTKADSDSEATSEEDTVPSSASDIPLSRIGALYLLIARKASATLFSSLAVTPEIAIFPDHALIVRNYLGRNSMTSIGTDGETTIDAILCLGFMAHDEQRVGQPQKDEDFNEYLQRLSLLSANTPSPTLRYHAHILTSSVLHSHPSDLVRLAFIRDTLEHCPYENLNACAVGWLKDEILAANNHRVEHSKKPSVFATPVAIDTTAPYIFPDLVQTLKPPLTPESRSALKLNFSFYLASLNFYYLLLSSQNIRDALDVVSLHKKHDVSRRFLAPLRMVGKQDLDMPESESLLNGDRDSDNMEDLSDLWILGDALHRVFGVLKDLGLD